MKTVEERAKEFIESLDLSCESQAVKIEKKLITLLKEQDKITRHACAESILLMPHGYAARTSNKVVSVDEVERAIINTKAI
jgi:hypothetical protein